MDVANAFSREDLLVLIASKKVCRVKACLPSDR